MNSLPIKKEGKIRTSFKLLKACWQIFRQNPSLVWFPILTTLVSIASIIAVLILIAGPILFYAINHVGSWSNLVTYLGKHDFESILPSFISEWFLLLPLFLFYWASFAIVIFFNVALISEASKAIHGGTVNWREGVRFAWSKLSVILKWSAFSAFVGVLLNIIEERIPKAGWITRRLLGAAWALANILVVPILVHESIGPLEALKRSTQFLKRTWGENIVGRVALSTATSLLLIIPWLVIGGLVIIGFIIHPWPSFMIVVLAVAVLILVLIYSVTLIYLSAALQGIFQAVLYSYAVEGVVPVGFDKNLLQQIWRVK